MNSRRSNISLVISELRSVLPRSEIVVTAIVGLLAIEGIWVIASYFDHHGNAPNIVLALRDAVVITLMAAFGGYRVFAFHPLFNTDYLRWLAASPWQSANTLPLGTISPRWADAVVVAAMTLLLADPRIVTHSDFARPSPLTGAAMFVISHCCAVAVMIWLTGSRRFAYAAFFLIAAGLRFGADAPIVLPWFLIAAWGVSLRGLSESWRAFPWNDTVEWGRRLKQKWNGMQSSGQVAMADQIAPDRVPVHELGWPFAVLSPTTPPLAISRHERLLIAVLICFGLHAVLTVTAHHQAVQGGVAFILAYAGLFLPIGRLAELGGHHASPLSIGGRLSLWKWIIPGYDQVAVAPICILLATASTAAAGHFLFSLSIPVLVPLTLLAACLTFILIGPDATTWKLTAPARLHHGRLHKRSFDQLT